jgi:hypothetical protein
MDTALLAILLAVSVLNFGVTIWLFHWVKTHRPPPVPGPHRLSTRAKPLDPAPLGSPLSRPEPPAAFAPDGDVQVFYTQAHRVLEVVNARAFRIKTPPGAPSRFGPTTYVEIIGVTIADYTSKGPRNGKAFEQVKRDLADRNVWLEEDISLTQDHTGNRLCAYVEVSQLCRDYGKYLIDRGLANAIVRTPYLRREDYERFQAQRQARRGHP